MLRRSVGSLLSVAARRPAACSLGSVSLSRTTATTAPTITTLKPRYYHQNVLDHYENPRNIGSLNTSNPAVGTGLVGAPACGDVMKMQVLVNPVTGVIEDVKIKTYGCGSAIASSSFASEWLKGKTVEEALKIKNTDIARYLNLPPVKLHCSMLAEDATKAALQDYQRKQQLQDSSSTSEAPKVAQVASA